MGRNSTGVWSTEDALILDLSWLIKKGYLVRGHLGFGTIHWNIKKKEIASVQIFTVYTDLENYVRLSYTIKQKDEKTNIICRVDLMEKPSNLGKGNVPFFKCPVSGKPCRKLYMAYGSTIFKSREAYQNRIYYPIQIEGKRSLDNERFWILSKQIKSLEKERFTFTYAGKITRRAARMERLLHKQWIADERRWLPITFPHSLRKALEKGFEELDK